MQTEQSTEENTQGRVALSYLPRNVALIRLGSAEERIVVLDEDRLRSLAEALERLRDAHPRGLVICGPHAEMFTAGADIQLLQGIGHPALAEELSRTGQAVFNILAGFPFPTVCAISGPCLGAGFELALACHYRISSDHKSTIIGLPEVGLGIVPAFGGTQRLPRLIGLPRALDLIVEGRVLKPRQALLAGLVDEVTSLEKLLERAGLAASSESGLKKRRLGWIKHYYTFIEHGRNRVRRKVEERVRNETRGFYPAPQSALQTVFAGLEKGLAEGLKLETSELVRLLSAPQCRGMARLLILTEAARRIGQQARKKVEHVQAVVLGAGTMGAGIAASLACHDCAVVLKDTSDELLSRARKHLLSYLMDLPHLSEQERSFRFNRVEVTAGPTSSEGNANFAIEAVPEDLELKKKALGELAGFVPPDTLIASNTSTLSISELASALPFSDRVVGMHFFKPAEKTSLVEIIRGRQTSDRAVVLAAALALRLGKSPLVVKDSPGFLVNRILMAYLGEAEFLLAEADLSAIEAAACDFGMATGPFRQLDEMGLDLAMRLQSKLESSFGERLRGGGTFDKLLCAGRAGRKLKAGYYDYTDREEKVYQGLRGLLGLPLPLPGLRPAQITERLVLRMINEAVLCHDEGVAGIPGPDASGQIDLGSVLGAGFPAFRGGVLTYADSLGARQVYENLLRLEKEAGPRFAPCAGISRRAERKRSLMES